MHSQCCDSSGNGLKYAVDVSDINALKMKDEELKTAMLGATRRLDEVKIVVEDNTACCEENKNKNIEQDKRLDEINANISCLKGMFNEHEVKIRKTEKTIVTDDKYLNFDEWYQKVFLPNKDKFKAGDIYINNNQNHGATNNTWIYTGNVTLDDVENLFKNGWTNLPTFKPSDVIEILGIDPVIVNHPTKNKWIVSLDPLKLAKLLGSVPELDLTNVKLKLGQVVTNPVYEEDVMFKLDVTIKGDTHLNNLFVTGVSNFNDVTVEGDLKVDKIISPNVTFSNDVTVNENVTINNHTTTTHLTVAEQAKFNNVDFDGIIRIPTKDNKCAVYSDNEDPYVSINQTIFQPSFARFVITAPGAKYGARAKADAQLWYEWDPSIDGTYRSRVLSIGGKMVGVSIQGQVFKGKLGDLVPMSYNTPDIEQLDDLGIILIKNSGVYDISYLYNFSQSRNVWANRAGIALVRGDMLKKGFTRQGDLMIEDLIDNKREGSSGSDDMTDNKLGPNPNAHIVTDHIYSGYDYTSLDRIDKWSGHMGMSLQSWSASGSTIVEIPCGQTMAIVPYVKPSIHGGTTDLYPEWNNRAWILMKDGKWDTGALSQITIKKIANSTDLYLPA